METVTPRLLRIRPSAAVVMPLPTELTTPPVTKMYLGIGPLLGDLSVRRLSATGRPSLEAQNYFRKAITSVSMDNARNRFDVLILFIFPNLPLAFTIAQTFYDDSVRAGLGSNPRQGALLEEASYGRVSPHLSR